MRNSDKNSDYYSDRIAAVQVELDAINAALGDRNKCSYEQRYVYRKRRDKLHKKKVYYTQQYKKALAIKLESG